VVSRKTSWVGVVTCRQLAEASAWKATTVDLSAEVLLLPRHLQDAESLYASFIAPPFPPTSHIPTEEHIN
jgi:hypothetical protein